MSVSPTPSRTLLSKPRFVSALSDVRPEDARVGAARGDDDLRRRWEKIVRGDRA